MTQNRGHDKTAPEVAQAGISAALPKPWLARVKARVKELFNTVDDRCAQLRHGSHKDHRHAIIARLKELPGGEALLLQAKKHDVRISVVSLRRNNGSKGKFMRSKRCARVRVSNTGNDALMATTLWHELRHMQQHIERGDMTGGSTRVLDTRAQHMISLMIEADAFTAQILMGLRQKKTGNPEYFNALMQRESPAFDAVRNFLKKMPYENVTDETIFARGLFTELMLTGLPTYQAKYIDAYGRMFANAKNVEEFRKQVAGKKAPPDFKPSPELHGIYGATPPDLRHLAGIFLLAQPRDLHKLVGKVDDTTHDIANLDEEHFQQAKAEIVGDSKRLAKAFRKNAIHAPRGGALRKAALRPL